MAPFGCPQDQRVPYVSFELLHELGQLRLELRPHRYEVQLALRRHVVVLAREQASDQGVRRLLDQGLQRCVQCVVVFVDELILFVCGRQCDQMLLFIRSGAQSIGIGRLLQRYLPLYSKRRRQSAAQGSLLRRVAYDEPSSVMYAEAIAGSGRSMPYAPPG